jgi:hypothetical protein
MIALTSVSLARAKLAKREVSFTFKARESCDQTKEQPATNAYLTVSRMTRLAWNQPKSR